MRKLKFGFTLMCFLSINLSLTYSQSVGQLLKKGSTTNPPDYSNLFEYTSGATIKRLIFPFNSTSFNYTDYCFEIKVPSLNSNNGFQISNSLGTTITLINPDGFALFQTGGLSGKNYLQSKTAIGGTGMFNPVTTLHVNGSGLFTKNLAIGQSSEATAQLQITSSDTVKIKFTSGDVDDSIPVVLYSSRRGSDFQFWSIAKVDTNPMETSEGGGVEPNPNTISYTKNLAFTIKSKGEIQSSYATFSKELKASSIYASNAFTSVLVSKNFRLTTNPAEGKILVSTKDGDGRWLDYTEAIPQYWINNGSGAIYTDKLSVGIKTGLTGPYDLAVNGIIGCKELKVEINSAIWAWPDYVFAPEYNLPSLDEVELFVKENGHLPDVPSSDSISKEGISIGEMQAVLLKKVEELTLYIIEQNKHIKEQELQIDNLKSLLIK